MTTTDTSTGSDLLDRLLEQAPPTASQPKRGQNYNYPERLYLKPDGTVVKLQGDPSNRAYYQDKGYHLLSDAPGRGGRKSEVREYLEDEYPKILAEQKERAKIINAIRKASERDRNLNLEDTFDEWTSDQLREYLVQIKEETGKNIRIVTPRNTPQARQEAAEARLLQGVETTEQSSAEALQSKLERGAGYDPLVERTRARPGRPA
jgi:hypothetical protein